ncbi:arylsulfatase regulator (Fe-S oxidoreductase) [Desulfitobacterium dehalogenans ATCC 51507]|uniref:Arylsulfatase regulator (Fe-S oxidoreductase) n=1 Tax=Desulfitobacterium dehalogenans (strain ATCC 51507 / DSM 9161 / JW/IU-DC1) TaxID=756499 RepID=I4AEK7_DESDJ|nr:radical SAM protein [Desulfitobacterium dehalogenans]AFM02392.1 arylsulfatase regulator (Fe-S oxidoreductase) [Desulfitobacterium dehalogenans ATCC 51507]
MYERFTIILSNWCNLRCPFCLQNATVNNGKEISAESLISFFESGKVAPKVFKLTGGEPLSPQVYEKTKKIVEYAISKGIRTQLNTNGTYKFTGDFDKELLNFQVSLDGLKEKHESLRGNGTFEKTVNFIKRVTKTGYKVNIMQVLQEETTRDEVEEFINFSVNEFNIHPKFQRMAPSGRASGNKEVINIDYDMDEFIENKGCSCRGVKYKCTTPEGKSTQIGIDQHGNIIPCPLLGKYKFGTIFNFNEFKIRQEISRKLKGCTCCYPDGYKGEVSFGHI